MGVIITLILLGLLALGTGVLAVRFGRALKAAEAEGPVPVDENVPAAYRKTKEAAHKEAHTERVNSLRSVRTGWRVLLVVSLLLAVGVILSQSIRVVGANEVGVGVTLGRVDKNPIGSGPALVAPWTDVEKLPTRPKTYVFDVPARTNEQGQATVQLQVRWATDRDKAADLYLQARTGDSETIERDIVNVQATAAAVNILGKKTNVEVVNGAHWTDNSEAIQRDLTERISGYGVVVREGDVQIKAVNASKETQLAIDRLAAQVNLTKVAAQSRLTAVEQAAQQKEAANGLVAAAKLLGQITPEQTRLLELQAGERIMNRNADEGIPTYTLPGQGSPGVGVLAGAK